MILIGGDGVKRFFIALLILSIIGTVPPFVRQIHRRFVGVNSQVYLAQRNMEYFYKKEVRTIVEQLAREINQPAVDAKIHKETGQVVPHQNGLYLDIDGTVDIVMRAGTRTSLEPILIEIVPPILADDLEPLIDTLGDFSTPVMGSPDRVTNIRLSLAAINNTLLLPGEVFSFNEVVGERTPEKGYRPAPIILGESVAPGVGGGICQVSTTLYNAVHRSNLETVERRIHSIAPSYIQHGQDATVAWPHTDYKFRNNADQPVIVKGEIQGWRVRVWIVGKNSGGSGS